MYAAKGHLELSSADSNTLLVTYATNRFEFADLFAEQGAIGLYWPRMVGVLLGG